MTGEDHETRKCTKGEKSNPLTMLTGRSAGLGPIDWTRTNRPDQDQSTELGPVDRFVGARNLKSLPRFIFSTVLLHFFRAFHIFASKDQFEQDFGLISSLGMDF